MATDPEPNLHVGIDWKRADKNGRQNSQARCSRQRFVRKSARQNMPFDTCRACFVTVLVADMST